MPELLITCRAAAEFLGITERQLFGWRIRNVGPRYVKTLRGRVEGTAYNLDDLEDFKRRWQADPIIIPPLGYPANWTSRFGDMVHRTVRVAR